MTQQSKRVVYVVETEGDGEHGIHAIHATIDGAKAAVQDLSVQYGFIDFDVSKEPENTGYWRWYVSYKNPHAGFGGELEVTIAEHGVLP